MFCVGFVCVCWQCLLLHLPGSPKEGKSWKDAQSICSSFAGSLVAIEDEIEQGRCKVNNITNTSRQEHFVFVFPCVVTRVREENCLFYYFILKCCIFLIFLLKCHHSCSVHHHVASGKLCRCVDWSAG